MGVVGEPTGRWTIPGAPASDSYTRRITDLHLRLTEPWERSRLQRRPAGQALGGCVPQWLRDGSSVCPFSLQCVGAGLL